MYTSRRCTVLSLFPPLLFSPFGAQVKQVCLADYHPDSLPERKVRLNGHSFPQGAVGPSARARPTDGESLPHTIGRRVCSQERLAVSATGPFPLRPLHSKVQRREGARLGTAEAAAVVFAVSAPCHLTLTAARHTQVVSERAIKHVQHLAEIAQKKEAYLLFVLVCCGSGCRPLRPLQLAAQVSPSASSAR